MEDVREIIKKYNNRKHKNSIGDITFSDIEILISLALKPLAVNRVSEEEIFNELTKEFDPTHIKDRLKKVSKNIVNLFNQKIKSEK